MRIFFCPTFTGLAQLNFAPDGRHWFHDFRSMTHPSCRMNLVTFSMYLAVFVAFGCAMVVVLPLLILLLVTFAVILVTILIRPR